MRVPPGPVTVARGLLKPGVGRAIASEAGVPLVAKTSYGAGWVVYLAFDLFGQPYQNWDGQAEFWKTVLQVVASNFPAARTMSSIGICSLQELDRLLRRNGQLFEYKTLLSLVARHPDVKEPSINTIGIFLLSYLIVLLPVNYFVLRRKRRLDLAWFTTPVVVLLFTVGAYALGYAIKGSHLRLREVRIIEGSQNARFASVVTDASLFSPARRSYAITVDDSYAIAQVVPVWKSDQQPSGVLDEKCSMLDLRMAMWSIRVFESVSGLDLGGTISANLRLNGTRLQDKILNGTRISFSGCVLCYGKSRAELRDLPPGASVLVDLDLQRRSTGVLYGSEDLNDALRRYAGLIATKASEPVLVAKPKFGSVFRVHDVMTDIESAAYCVFRLVCEGPYGST
ncbi:MAG: hypothetical protein N3B12_00150 [Armatimonadetes bacterium]|nr:hypothetical protein [Armatimonadota bacterium]